MKFLSFLILSALSIPVFSSTREQTGTITDEAQSVEVTGVRDPVIIPYKRAYELTSRVRDVGMDHVQLLFRVTSTQSHTPIPNLVIGVEGTKHHEKINISSSGFFSIPLNKEAYDDNADFVVNQKKGTMNVDVFFIPKFPSDSLNYASVVDAIKAARQARAEILPWYLRILTPTINGLGFCYANERSSVEMTGGGEQRRIAKTSETNDLGMKVFCANFSQNEPNLEPESILIPAEGWESIFIGSLF